MESANIYLLTKYLEKHRGIDFSGYQQAMLTPRVQKRIDITDTQNFHDYLEYLDNNHSEIDKLIDLFTINVSRFFRNPLSFEILRKIVIPDIILEKSQRSNPSFRIWSAGCSFGPEPYSIAILINEIIEKEKLSFASSIIATDIDKKALNKANGGCFSITDLRNMKLNIFNKYFAQNGSMFHINETIKGMVQFSVFNLLDKKLKVPPDSIFGGFDMVFCRNVLIYFNPDQQKIIFDKLYNSLNSNSYLILGEAEIPYKDYRHKLTRVSEYCKIYKKNE